MKVIKSSNLPSRFPLSLALLAFLMLDFYNAPGWLWGAIGCLFTLLVAAVIFHRTTAEEVDIFKNDEKK